MASLIALPGKIKLPALNNMSWSVLLVRMDEKNIVDLISKDYSWEQIIYQVVAWEGMDPWNVNLVTLSDAFLKFINRIQELDFRVPAKYVIISSVLLRMKSDHLSFLDIIHGAEEMAAEEPNGHGQQGQRPEIEINPITMPIRRLPRRRIAVAELVDALRKALKTEEKREIRDIKRRRQIVINEADITKRIEELYARINSIMQKASGEEVGFSQLVGKWERKEVADVFLPLIYLDHGKRVECRQDKPFEEIFIRKR